MKKNITFSFMAINVGLALVLGWQWLSPAGHREIQWEAPAPVKPQLNGAPSSSARGSVPSNDFAAMQERPIFSATRRPISAASAPVVARADPLDNVRLYGVIAGSDGGGVIVGSEGKTRRMKVSDALGDWRLQKIRDKEAVFARGAETRVISLAQVKQVQSAPPAASSSERPQSPFQRPTAAPLVVVPPSPTVVQQHPAAASQSRPVASSAKPAPGFLIGGSR